MENELLDLSTTLLNIYKKNLEFLKENFEEVFEKVDELSSKINDEKYSSKYSLEYKDGYFDILNLENDAWFYSTNSYEDADNRATHANFTKDGSLDLLRKGVDGLKLISSKSYKDVMPIVDYINENVDFKNIEFQKIYKYVFMGTGLGFHMHEINKKLNPFISLIIEPELEIFRLSLFVIDYTEFAKDNKTLFLSVGDNDTDRIKQIELFYLSHPYMNYNIKHHLFIESYEYIKEDLVEYFSTHTVTSFPYSLTVKNIYKTASFIKAKDRFLDVDSIIEKEILKDKNVLIVSAGPSLDNYIEWIQIHQDKFTIICVDVILRKLEKYNIVPDIVVSIDPSYLCADYLTTEDKSYLKNSTIVFLSQQDESVIKAVEGIKYYFSQSIPLINEIGYLGSVPNVGTYSFMISVHFGAKKIYTIGNDAAFNQETGSRYSSDSSSVKNDLIDNKIVDKNVISNHDIIEVDGNLQDKVKTNRTLITFKHSFEVTLRDLKLRYSDLEIYNLSDGAKLDGFIPLTYDEINKKINTFDSKEKNIIKLMDSISLVVDKPNFDDDLKILNSIIRKIKKHKSTKLKNRNDFLSKKLDVMVWLLEQCKEMSSPLFGNMFLLYTELSDIYINFLLNLRQEGLQDKEHLIKLNIIWSNGVVSVLKDIKKAVS